MANPNMPNKDTSKAKKDFPKYSEGKRETTKEQRGSEQKVNPSRESRWTEDKSKKGASGSSMKSSHQ
ncbi:MAG: hypothetical protein ACM3MG_01755 [Bacillota bacterium]